MAIDNVKYKWNYISSNIMIKYTVFILWELIKCVIIKYKHIITEFLNNNVII